MSTITFNVDYVLVDCGKDGCNQSFAMSRQGYRRRRCASSRCARRASARCASASPRSTRRGRNATARPTTRIIAAVRVRAQRKGGGHQLENLLATCRRAHTGWVHAPAKRDLARQAGLLVLPGDPGFDELGAES